MTCPPAKRQRIEDSPTTCPELKKSSDGKVVLLAGNTEFRVHWDVLALHSSVFRNMLGHPPSSEHPDVDGCPVVEQSDAPEEVDYLLKVLYTPAKFLEQYRVNLNDMGQYACARSIPLPVIRALLRLGRKYDFKDFCSWAVAQLEVQYPTTLEEFDRAGQLDSSTGRCTNSELVDIISLARENKVLSVLPSAYYCAVRFSETLAALLGEGGGRAISLPTVDLNRCIIGREKLLLQQFKPGYTFGWLQKWERKKCFLSKRCLAARDRILAKYLDDAAIEALQEPQIFPGLCNDCGQYAKKYMIAGRRKVWQELPEIFGVGSSWGDLQNVT